MDPDAQHDPDHGRQRDERLDLPVVGRREVARVERQEEDGENARDEPAEPVDRRVLAEPLELCAERTSEASVESEQAVGDAVEVVNLLDVGA